MEKDVRQKIVLRIGVVVFVLVICFIGYRLVQFAKSTITTNAPFIVGNTPTPTPEPDPGINILLLGYGGPKHDGPYLTDSMMIARFDPTRSTAYLLSLPRDLWVTLPTGGSGTPQKLNAAYAIGLDDDQYPDKENKYTGGHSGARAMTSDVVKDVTGLSMTHVLAVDFEGFIQGVDTLGGIDVKVAQSFEDKEYPLEGKETDLCGKDEKEMEEQLKTATNAAILFPCRYETIKFDKGIVHMDGINALKYVRSRHATNGSDFARSERQREIINAVKEKALSLGILSKLPELYKTLASHIATDITIQDVPSFASLLTTWSTYKITSIGLSIDNVLQQGTTSTGLYALFSVEGEGKWTLIKQYLYDLLHPEKIQKVALVQLVGMRSEKKRLETLETDLVAHNVVVTNIAYVNSPKEATQSSFLETRERPLSDDIEKGLTGMIPSLTVDFRPSAKSLYDGILTVAPLPTPTPTPLAD